MKRLLLLLLALFVASCSSDTNAPDDTKPLHNIPKAGSSFIVKYVVAGDELIDTITVTGTGEAEGHKNVLLFEYGFGPAYHENGDVSVKYYDGWITLPVKTQQSIVIPTTSDYSSSFYSHHRDKRIIPDGEENRVIGAKSYRCLKFKVQVENTLLDPNGLPYNDKYMTFGEVIWVPELGFTALLHHDGVEDTGAKMLTLNADLK